MDGRRVDLAFYQEAGALIELINKTIDIIDLSMNPIPIIWKIMPLGIQFREGLPLLLNPSKVFQIVNTVFVLIIQLKHMCR